MRKIAVFFPGIGYTVDKPILHYSRKLAQAKGYEIKLLPYGNFPEKVRGDRAKMVESYELALGQAQEMLKDVDFASYEEILFVGKSVGTIVGATVAAALKESLGKNVRQILYTPLNDTFRFPIGEAIAFTGTADPWVGKEKSEIGKICAEHNIICIPIEDADHSLETGNVQKDIDSLKLLMSMSERFMQ